MRMILAAPLLTLALLSAANAYDSMYIPFDRYREFLALTSPPAADDIRETLESYTKFADDTLEPLFRKIILDAKQSDTRLMNDDNIPILIEVTRGCGNMIAPLLTMETLGQDNLREYAQVMTYFGYLKLFEEELERFMSVDYEILKDRGYFDQVRSARYNVRETMERLAVESMAYSKFLLGSAETKSEAE